MFNWREVPFVRLLIPFIIGIALGLYINVPFHVFNIVILLLFIFIGLMANRKLTPQRKDVFSALVHIALLLTGYQLTLYQNDFHREQHFRHQLSEENTFIGIVKEIRSGGRFLNVTLAVEQFQNADSLLSNTCGNIMLSIDQAELKEAPKYGDQLIVSAKITNLQAPKNPEAFDYRSFLRMKGIYHQAFVRSENWEQIQTGLGNPILSYTGELRTDLLKTLSLYLPTENEYAVGAAMLLGFRDGMNEDIKNAYAGTGATHVMAVSGLHIGLVFLGLGLLLRLFYWRNRFMRFFKPSVMLFGIWLFALLSGASPSAMRAAFMFSLIIVSQSLNREGSIYNTLASSAFCLLAYNPFLLMEVGFQLSYLAVGGIVYFQPKIYKLWYIKNKLGDYIWKMASVGLAAQVMTFPLSIFYFHQFPVYFWLSGLIVVPAATLIIALGALLFFSHYYLPFLSFFIGKILWGVLTVMNGMIFMIRQLPAGLIEGIWVGIGVFVLLYFFIGAIILAINSEQSRWWAYALGLFVVVMGSTAFTNIQQQNQLEMVIYHTPKNTLVDFVSGKEIISLSSSSLSLKKKKQAAENYRSSRGISNIEELLLESDHLYENDFLKYQQPFVQFYNTRLALVDTLHFSPPVLPIEIDYLLLYDNPDYSLATLQQYFDFKKLIIGTSNQRRKAAQWLADCEASGIPCYNIYEEGAFIISPKELQKQ